MDRFDHLELNAESEPSGIASTEPLTRQAPTDGPSFYRAARQMREAGFFGAAAGFYERAVGFDDQNYRAWVQWVDCLVRGGKAEQADAVSREAVSNYGQVRLFYASRALALAHQGAFQEALPQSDVSVEGKEPHWYALCIRAELYLRMSQDNLEVARKLLEEAVEKGMGWEPHFIGGWALMDTGWPALAAGYFSEAVRCRPSAAAGLICLGDAFRALRLHDQAMFYYQKVTEVEPNHQLALERQKACAPSLFGLMRVFRRENLRKRWNREFEKLVKHWEPTINDF